MKKVKTLFVPASYEGKSVFSSHRYTVDGVQTTREIQAAIDEMEIDDYEFFHSENFTSAKHSVSYSSGTILYFRKINSPT